MGVGAAILLRAWPTPHRASKGIPGPLCRRASPSCRPFQDLRGRRRSGPHRSRAGAGANSSCARAPRGVEHPGEAASDGLLVLPLAWRSVGEKLAEATRSKRVISSLSQGAPDLIAKPVSCE